MAMGYGRLLALGGVAVIFGACLLHALARRWRRRRILEEGRPVRAWIVQANGALFQPGAVDLPALVLVSFEPGSDARVEALARRMYGLKTEPSADDDERAVARLVRNEAYRPESRRLLPASFTGGLEVYAAHVLVRRRFLPGRRLSEAFLTCRALPGDKGEVVMCDPTEQYGAAARD
jgi:hypothetical protein